MCAAVDVLVAFLLFFVAHFVGEFFSSVLLSLNRLFIYLFFFSLFSSLRVKMQTHTQSHWASSWNYLLFYFFGKVRREILNLSRYPREGSSWKNPSVCLSVKYWFFSFLSSTFIFELFLCLEIFSEFKVIFTLFFINAFLHSRFETWLWDNPRSYFSCGENHFISHSKSLTVQIIPVFHATLIWFDIRSCKRLEEIWLKEILFKVICKWICAWERFKERFFLWPKLKIIIDQA